MDTKQILLILCIGGSIFLLWGSISRYKKERIFSNIINFVVGIPLLILGIWGFFSSWMDERRIGLLFFAGGAMLFLLERIDQCKRNEQTVKAIIFTVFSILILLLAIWGLFFTQSV